MLTGFVIFREEVREIFTEKGTQAGFNKLRGREMD